MTTIDTRSQLLREIAARPDDDTLRLAFADWLDEHGDAADADRAEFVRLDVERHRRWPDFARVCEADRKSAYPDWERLAVVEKRLLELGTARPEWSRLPCPECEGKGYVVRRGIGGQSHASLHPTCLTCGGTGDLFLARGVSGASLNPPPKSRTVAFARGFADSVTCTLAEAFKRNDTPTPWSLTVVTQTPVTRFVLTDREPLERLGAGNRFRWWGDSPQIGRTVELRYVIPRTVFRELVGDWKDWEYTSPTDFCWEYATAGAAADALAIAAGRVVRRYAYHQGKV